MDKKETFKEIDSLRKKIRELKTNLYEKDKELLIKIKDYAEYEDIFLRLHDADGSRVECPEWEDVAENKSEDFITIETLLDILPIIVKEGLL